MSLEIKTLPAVVALTLAMAAGWGIGAWRAGGQLTRQEAELGRLKEENRVTHDLLDAALEMSQKATQHALNQQTTLNICLDRLGIKTPK